MTRGFEAIPTDLGFFAISHYFWTPPIRGLPVLERGSLLGRVSRRHVLRGIGEMSRKRLVRKPSGMAGPQTPALFLGRVPRRLRPGSRSRVRCSGRSLPTPKWPKKVGLGTRRSRGSSFRRLWAPQVIGQRPPRLRSHSTQRIPSSLKRPLAIQRSRQYGAPCARASSTHCRRSSAYYQPGNQDPENLDPLMPVPVPAFLRRARIVLGWRTRRSTR